MCCRDAGDVPCRCCGDPTILQLEVWAGLALATLYACRRSAVEVPVEVAVEVS